MRKIFLDHKLRKIISNRLKTGSPACAGTWLRNWLMNWSFLCLMIEQLSKFEFQENCLPLPRVAWSMGAVRITSWCQKFNWSLVGLPPSSIHQMEIGAMLLFFMLLKSAILCDLYLLTYIICAIETPCDANLLLPFVSIHFFNSRCYF